MTVNASIGEEIVRVPVTLGNVPKCWAWGRLEDLCEGIYDCPHSTPALAATGPYVVRTQDILTGVFLTGSAAHVSENTYTERTMRAVPRRGDLLYSREGTYFGIAAEVPESVEVCLGQRMVLIRPDETIIDFRFLRYWLNSRVMASYINGFRDGTVAERLNLPTIRSLPILIPPLSEQSSIADVLGALDDKIAVNGLIMEKLDALTREIFRQDFAKPALNTLPRDWRAGTLADMCTTQYGYTASATDEAAGPKFLRVKDINKKNWIEWDSVPYCNISEVDRAKYSLSLGDVVVARMADPGKSAIIEDPADAVFASYLVRLKTNSLARSYYIYGFLKSDTYADYRESVRGGSVQANMNARVIIGATLPIPPAELLEAHLRRILPLRRRLMASLKESFALAQLRDTLLPKFMSGEIRVRDAEKVVEDMT